jgi:ATP-dependent helicase HrpB
MPHLDTLLPIDAALPELAATLAAHSTAVLVAPPGAGKSTRVPLVLAAEAWAKSGRILVLEPRRLAARAAAARMAASLGEAVGDTIGLRVRFESRRSAKTRIEIVTEGVFTRMVLDDPSLDGIAAVLFDEFHERSLDADLGLALARDAQQGLRPDLRLLVMSATLDAARISALLGDCPVVTSEGRSFPIETRYVGRDAAAPIERQVAEVTARALRADSGSVLVFLPGAAEIRRAEAPLRERVSDPAVDIVPLYGALDAAAQDRAIAPARPGRRKVVLATSIAETSLTIEGVRTVVDCGLARVPRYEPDVGLTRLETVRVSRAAADQRRGRAGRLEPGLCYRLWDEPQTGSLAPYTQPEILAADLSGFVLDLAEWGIADPAKLTFLDPPPAAALAEARALLSDLGAIDADSRITDEGRRLRQLPVPPRLARMIVDAARAGDGALAAEIAVLLTERGLGGNNVDLSQRLEALRRDGSQRAVDARRVAARWSELAGHDRAAGTASSPRRRGPITTGLKIGQDASHQATARSMSPRLRGDDRLGAIGPILALAYPDRIAKNRGGGSGAFLLANGRGGSIDPASPLAREPYLVVAELAGRAGDGRILLAAAITADAIEASFADRVESRDDLTFDTGRAALRRRQTRRLRAVVLSEQILAAEPGPEAARVLADGILRLGLDRLPWTKALRQWRDRVAFLRRAESEEWPDLSDAALAETTSDWLVPALADKTALAALSADHFTAALQALLPWPLRRRLETEAPTHITLPSGRSVAIEYEAEAGPTVSGRVQEFFGLTQHPSIAGRRIPLVIEMLSPAERPVQVTRDLPGFWRGSYAAVRAELRGRYPRHPWPDDPLTAPATRRAKPR